VVLPTRICNTKSQIKKIKPPSQVKPSQVEATQAKLSKARHSQDEQLQQTALHHIIPYPLLSYCPARPTVTLTAIAPHYTTLFTLPSSYHIASHRTIPYYTISHLSTVTGNTGCRVRSGRVIRVVQGNEQAKPSRAVRVESTPDAPPRSKTQVERMSVRSI
jgi:CHAT domain-containing protein